MLRKHQNKLQETKLKVSKEWKLFNAKKNKILARKKLPPEFKRGLIAEQRAITKSKIFRHYANYRSYVYISSHKSDLKGFKLTYKFDTEKSEQFTYQAQRGTGKIKTEKTIVKLLKNDNVKGVMAIIKVKDEETGKIMYVSDFISKNLLKRLNEQKKGIYSHVAEKAKLLKSSEEFREVGFFIKVIYAKA